MSNLILAADSRTSVDQSPEVDELLALDAVVAFGVSGGKDSVAAALAGHEYLEKIGHQGPRVLVHSDLGRVEWRSSLAKCEEIARHLGYDLLVKKRQAGDLMDRWLVRWDRNVARYTDLSCVKLILPWSTPSMRFCTSELGRGKRQSCSDARGQAEPGVCVKGGHWLHLASHQGLERRRCLRNHPAPWTDPA
ncbi:TPA: hypothetical protein L4A50_005601 [Pseudomonas aeruginosa]|nr:hypothetical protein [Pseudomonas aeruginosa]HBO0253320.1 hypothetical protein [Pseudomonas aeruginosa]